jgi:mono/diheme cytochrome c family protein
LLTNPHFYPFLNWTVQGPEFILVHMGNGWKSPAITNSYRLYQMKIPLKPFRAIHKLARVLPLLAMPAFAQDGSADAQWEMLNRYCVDCHNFEDWAGEVAFDLMTPDALHAEPDTFEMVLQKLSGRLMPPPGSDQPQQAEIDDFMAWVEHTLDNNADIPRAGHVPIQRLNRTEYESSVKDLVGVEINAAEFLPTEIEVDGFDNMAEALSVSPAFLAQFIRAARLTAHTAVGAGEAKTAVATYRTSSEDQTGYNVGMPPGTRGGMSFVHNFPADGEYNLNFLGLSLGSSQLETAHTLVVLIDGTEVFREQLGGPEDFELVERTGPAGSALILERFTGIPVAVKAGPHKVVATFIERSQAQSLYWTDSGDHNRMPRLGGGIEVVGPFNVTGISMTPSREKIFVCYPGSADEEAACARQITENLAKRAFGRQVTEEDMNTLMPFYHEFAATNGFEAGVEQVVAAVLSSPYFLYRSVVPDAGQENEEYFRLDDLELASRVAYFLWSQRPDEELLDLAIAGRLSDPQVLQAQVRRMLEDSRASALVQNFAIKWLNLDNLEDVDPNPQLFPEYSDGLLEDMSEEMRLFLGSVLFDDRPVTDLMTADYTYLNERLARHYGIDGVYGAQFRKVPLTDETRWGLLGKASVMMRTSYGDRTSVVLRGNYVLEKLMGSPSPPPPPNVETDLSVAPGQKVTTLRARMEQHRANPSCNQCHGFIDPIGFALENFSVTGKWRERDVQAGEDIDTSAEMPGGIAIDGPVDLRNALTTRPEKFVRTFTARMMMYALARELEYFDMPQVREIVKNAEAGNYHLYDLVMGIINSDAFRYQAREEHPGEVVAAVVNQQQPIN